MLSHVARARGDQVGLLAFDAEVRASRPRPAGRRATQRIVQARLRLTAEACARPTTAPPSARAGSAGAQARLVVLFTQVVDEVGARELSRFARGLMPRHLALMVLFRDAAVERIAEAQLASGAALDLCMGGAAAEMLLWRERLLGELGRAGVLTLDVTPKQLTAALIRQYLEIKARQLL